MKIIKNIPGLAVIIKSLFKVRKFKSLIDNARACGNIADEQKYILEACQTWSGYVIDKFQVSINIVNEDNLPQKGPVVFISNHQSYADILTFLTIIKNHQVAFIAKEELEKIPVFGSWIRRIRGIFIRRGDARASLETIKEGISFLEKGFSLVIFPEGTRSKSSDIGQFKSGSFKLATKAKVPIVPVTLDGGYRMYEDDGIVKKGCCITCTIHDPIITSDMDRHLLAQVPMQIEEIIKKGLA